MPDSYLLFHEGTFFSAVRLPDQMFVTLDAKFQETAEFSTFDEWYTLTLRSEYDTHYGLPLESDKS